MYFPVSVNFHSKIKKKLKVIFFHVKSHHMMKL